MSCILALDEGTTSARAIVFGHDGAILGVAQRPVETHFPHDGWVEQDAEDIWRAQIDVAMEALQKAGLLGVDVRAVGITNQRETTIVWDRRTLRPICPAIIWQDRRTAELCGKLEAEGRGALVRERTGLVIDPYFSASKIEWILESVPDARRRAEHGELAFGTVDAWLLAKLTEGSVHATDATNASRTLLYDIHRGEWDDELLALFGVPRAMLPDVRASSGTIAPISTALGLGGRPVAGIAGDQQAALFGQLCTEPGLTKVTYGTGCFVLQASGERAVASTSRLLTTVARREEDRLHYALEGSVFIGGALIDWLRDGLGIVETPSEVDVLADSVPDSGGVMLVPAFAGLGAPYWDPYARGMMIGLTRGVTKAHIARAALEGIAHQVADVLDAMRADTGGDPPELRVDGGLARSDVLMQIQADLSGVPVVRPAITETTALGAAYLAGLAVGFWKDLGELAAHRRVERTFEPRIERDDAAARRERWRRAVERAKSWADVDAEPAADPARGQGTADAAR